MLLVRALATGFGAAGMLLLLHLRLLLPPSVLVLALWTGVTAAPRRPSCRHLRSRSCRPMLSTPERVQRALRSGLPVLRDYWRATPMFDTS